MKASHIYIVAIILGLVIGYWLWATRRKAMVPPPSGTTDPTTQVLNCDKTLRRGSRGEEVALLQTWINATLQTPMRPIVVDSIFGSQTETALNHLVGRKATSLSGLPQQIC